MDPVTLMAVAATGLQAAGQLRQGKAIKQQKDFEEAQLKQQATARYAEGTREAYEERRRADIVSSNARAAMAASGGTTTDEGASEQLAKIGAEGDYNVLASLFDAKVDAQSLQTRAAAADYEGKLARKESRFKALSTVIGGASDWWGGFNTEEPYDSTPERWRVSKKTRRAASRSGGGYGSRPDLGL